MDRHTFPALALAALVLATGCLGATGPGGPDPATTAPSPTPTPGPLPTSDAPATDSPTATPTVPTTDPPATDTPVATPTPVSPGTDDAGVYEVKRALQRTYSPGTCFGMPTVVTNETRDRTLDRNAALVDRFCADYGLERNQSRELYRLVEQFRQIRVEALDNGSYAFHVSDGECCEITEIRGVYDPGTGAVRETNRTVERVPC